ncbi:MAG: hypothetical protein SGILL_010264 [Bacillariaceae sp.]
MANNYYAKGDNKKAGEEEDDKKMSPLEMEALLGSTAANWQEENTNPWDDGAVKPPSLPKASKDSKKKSKKKSMSPEVMAQAKLQKEKQRLECSLKVLEVTGSRARKPNSRYNDDTDDAIKSKPRTPPKKRKRKSPKVTQKKKSKGQTKKPKEPSPSNDLKRLPSSTKEVGDLHSDSDDDDGLESVLLNNSVGSFEVAGSVDSNIGENLDDLFDIPQVLDLADMSSAFLDSL